MQWILCNFHRVLIFAFFQRALKFGKFWRALKFGNFQRALKFGNFQCLLKFGNFQHLLKFCSFQSLIKVCLFQNMLAFPPMCSVLTHYWKWLKAFIVGVATPKPFNGQPLDRFWSRLAIKRFGSGNSRLSSGGSFWSSRWADRTHLRYANVFGMC